MQRSRSFVALRAVLLALACTSVLAACGLPFDLRTPDDFARVERPPPPYRWRAVSAYGVAMGVRTAENETHAALDFWVEAIDRTLRRGATYTPAGMTSIRSANGVPGRRLEYRYGDPNAGSVYIVVVFTTSDRVHIVEAGGAPDAMARARPGVERAIASYVAR